MPEEPRPFVHSGGALINAEDALAGMAQALIQNFHVHVDRNSLLLFRNAALSQGRNERTSNVMERKTSDLPAFPDRCGGECDRSDAPSCRMAGLGQCENKFTAVDFA